MNDSSPRTGPDEVTSPAFDSRKRTRNRLILVGMIILGMLPLLAAVFIYYGNPEGVSGAQTNRGALLVPPAQLPELGLQDEGGLVIADGPRLWRLVMFIPGPCDEACLENLHQIRQLQVLLGRDQNRVIRLAAFEAPQDAATIERLDTFFPELERVDAAPGTLRKVLSGRQRLGGDALDPDAGTPGNPLPDSGILVVDPLGNVIFFHGLQQIGEPLLFDMKRLLRLSNIG